MNTWHLSTDHAAATWGDPVLVSPAGTAYGVADVGHIPASEQSAARAAALGTSPLQMRWDARMGEYCARHWPSAGAR